MTEKINHRAKRRELMLKWEAAIRADEKDTDNNRGKYYETREELEAYMSFLELMTIPPGEQIKKLKSEIKELTKQRDDWESKYNSSNPEVGF